MTNPTPTPTPTPTGRFDETDGRPTIRFERTFPHPATRVWAALVEPERLADWFPSSIDCDAVEIGAPIEFRFREDAYPPIHGEFREVSEPHRLSFTWGEDLLTFELEVAGEEACRLRFTVVLDAAGKAARDGAGWDTCLDLLAGTLDGRSRPVPERETAEFRDYYEAWKASGVPATAEIPTAHTT